MAVKFPTVSVRDRALEQLRRRGADGAPIGSDALVAHLGARRAVGNEAVVALELARRLAHFGSRVGVASGRSRLTFRSDPTYHHEKFTITDANTGQELKG